jgi:hypothetical protein
LDGFLNSIYKGVGRNPRHYQTNKLKMKKKKHKTIKIDTDGIMYIVQERNYRDDAESTLLSVFNICMCVSSEVAEEACMKYTRNKNMLRYNSEAPFWYKKHESGKAAKIVDFKTLQVEL